MSNYDFTTAANLAKESFKPKYENVPIKLMKHVVSLADLAIVKGSAAASGDTFDLMVIPAGTMVVGVAVRTLVPVAGGSVSSPTVAIGDQSAASFQAACAVDAAANTVVAGSGAYLQAATVPYACTGGKFFSAANSVRLTLGGTWTSATAGSFQVLVEVVELGTGLLN